MRLKTTLLALISLTALMAGEPALAQQTSNTAVSEALRMARNYADADNLKAVVVHCDEAILLNPKCIEAYTFRGWARQYSGAPSGALSDYEKVIQLDPNNVEGYLGRASIKMDRCQHQQALKDLDIAMRLTPNNARVHMALSRYWSEVLNYESAIEEATIAIRYEPNDSMYYRTRARFKSLLGDMAGAIRDCSTAIKINPKDAIAYGQRGDLLIQSKDQTSAIKDFEAGLRVAPHDISCNFNIACEMLNSGHFAEAISKFDVVTRLRPSKETYILRGYCKMELQQCSEAIKDYTAALALDKSDAFIYFLRAQCRAHSGDIVGSVTDFTISTINKPSLGINRLSACLQRFWYRLTSSVNDFH